MKSHQVCLNYTKFYNGNGFKRNNITFTGVISGYYSKYVKILNSEFNNSNYVKGDDAVNIKKSVAVIKNNIFKNSLTLFNISYI